MSAPPNLHQRPSEEALIARYFAPLAGPAGLGLRDDAACLTPPPGHDLVVTKDALVAGVHFFADDPPDTIAQKALRVNLSDLAAKAAEPAGFLLGLALPHDWTEAWLAAFANGLGEDAAMFACPLLGGDTVATPGPLTLSVTALGFVPCGQMLRRQAAQPGDMLFVSGSVGDAALGLALRRPARDGHWARSLDATARAHLVARYLLPQPRLALREALRDHAHAAMDISDGLAGDCAKMLDGQGLTARIDLGRLPLSHAARALLSAAPALMEVAATGGDDYEILCAVPEARARDFVVAAKAAGTPVTAIGAVIEGDEPPQFLSPQGEPITFARGSFSHF